MKTSSKKWWKIADSLLRKPIGISSIPPLKRPDGTWARDGFSKATLLSETFRSKSQLPDPEINEFTPQALDLSELDNIKIEITESMVLPVLKKLDINSGTGPDQIAARVLKFCQSELTYPIMLLCNRILASGKWPMGWRLHWIHPIFKRKSRADPGNYRGVHLTSQLSKVCERILYGVLLPYLDFGEHQFAYTAGRGHRDALLSNILQWLLWLENGDQIGLYCSDVSGAFDRVSKDLLCRKLLSCKLPRCLFMVVTSWFDDRIS